MLSNTNILLVRHGEKPGDPGKDDPKDGPNLSPAGWQRAEAYIAYFENFAAVAVDGSAQTKQVPIDYVFAAADNYLTSYRPRLTISLFADVQTGPDRYPLALPTRATPPSSPSSSLTTTTVKTSSCAGTTERSSAWPTPC